MAAWNRTLSLMGDEPFFMLFSDDDVMEPDCVRRFYEELEKNPTYDVYHFNLSLINSKSEVITSFRDYPRVLSMNQFYIESCVHNRLAVRMPEFIFRTSKFKETGGFVYFPRAMATDNATVMSVGKETGIYTINGARMRWRTSDEQVSKYRDRDTQNLYFEVVLLYDNWMYKDYFIHLPSKLKIKKRWRMLKHFSTVAFNVSMKERIKMFRKSEMMRKYPYLICVIPPLWAVKRIKQMLEKDRDIE